MTTMLSEALREFLGLLEQLITNLLGNDAKEWTEELKRFLRKEPCWTIRLLSKLTTTKVGGAKRFVASEHLRQANVGYTGENFKKLFLDKVEESVEEAVVAVHRLERGSKDPAIMAELGERAQIQLAHFFGLLEKQANGEPGPMLTNGYANVAYIIGSDGNVWAVRAHWDSDRRYWHVSARSVVSPGGWNAGDQVLSRDS